MGANLSVSPNASLYYRQTVLALHIILLSLHKGKISDGQHAAPVCVCLPACLLACLSVCMPALFN
jgi:hypothetical protein